MKIYQGARYGPGDVEVVVAEDGAQRPLDLRTDLMNHSPTGFEWGYGGSGPAQLALAILADALEDDQRSLRLHQPFKFALVGGIPQDKPWAISDTLVQVIADRIERKLFALENLRGETS